MEQVNLLKRILNVMGDIDYIQKGENKVNGQYRFVSHDQVTKAIHPLLVKHGIVIIPSVKSIKQEGNRTEVLLSCILANADNEKDLIQVEFPGYGIDTSDKGPGKAISYAYKYTLLKLFVLETGDDPDQDQNTRYEPAKCLEFDTEAYIGLTEKDALKMKLFLEDCAESWGKHVEDVKREAMKRLPDFMKAFNNWKPKGK